MKPRPFSQRFSDPPSPMRWITHIAFVIALAVLIARITTPDALRDPWETTPGSQAVPSAPGAGTALVFDLLGCLPALLILIRHAIDRRFNLKAAASHWLLFALAIWALLSSFWSSDQFAAAVNAAHFFSASVLLWAMFQLVRSAMRFRLVAALMFGLMLVLVGQSFLYLRIDVPDNIAYWKEHKTEILKEHNWPADSFMARQFEHKLISGELSAFFNSPNTFAAVGVLLFAACVGIGFQKVRDGEPKGWLFQPAIAAVSLIWILLNARSKTSAITPFLGIAALLVFFLWRKKRDHSSPADPIYPGITPPQHAKAFGFTLILIAFATIALVGHGMYHHGLFPGHFSNSLDFRWKYWVASAGIFIAHPLIGIGWSNYGLHYLAHRLPEASEEIKDPHNFIVRFFVELGIIGGCMAVAWLLRVFWEITRPAPIAKSPPADDEPITIKSAATIVLLGIALTTLANIDFNQSAGDVILALLMKPFPYLFALLLGTLSAAMLSQHSWSLDDRPAPWIFCCTVTGLGLFLVHNLIDFSWFETGALFAFMALLGSTGGIAKTAETTSDRRIFPAVYAVGGILIWACATGFFVGPILLAEQSAADANEQIRTAPIARSAESAAHFQRAADDLAIAARLVPFNADYVFRQAQACIGTGDLTQAAALLNRVKQMDPMQLDGYLLDANLQLSQPHPNAKTVCDDFSAVTKLNPNDVPLHMQFGDALQRFGMTADAREQYKLALNANAALPEGEPKRLSPEETEILRKKAGIDVP